MRCGSVRYARRLRPARHCRSRPQPLGLTMIAEGVETQEQLQLLLEKLAAVQPPMQPLSAE